MDASRSKTRLCMTQGNTTKTKHTLSKWWPYEDDSVAMLSIQHRIRPFHANNCPKLDLPYLSYKA